MSAEAFYTEARDAILAATNAGAAVPTPHDVARVELGTGAVLLALRVDLVAVDVVQSNVNYQAAEFEAELLYDVADPADEGPVRTKRLADQAAILPPSFWTALTSVYQVAEGPETREVTTREGDVISHTVAGRVLLTP